MIEENEMKLKVIGASLPRTGTLTMKTALEKIGFGKCYHMKEVVFNDHGRIWAEIYQNKRKDFDTVLKNFHSTVDTPGCFFWEELLEQNPDAKVILTVRDSPEAWFNSCNDTILNTIIPSRCPFGATLLGYFVGSFGRFTQLLFEVGKRFPQTISKEELVKMYNAYISYVKEKCPKDKLLVYNVKEGWEPLCKFLNVPIPKEEFPKVNDTSEFKRCLFRVSCMGYFFLFLSVGIFAQTAYLIKKYLMKKLVK